METSFTSSETSQLIAIHIISPVLPHVYSVTTLTLILLMWRIWQASNNASNWQMGFNLAFKG